MHARVVTFPFFIGSTDALVVSMPRGNDAVSSRLEGFGGLDDDIDRLARLTGLISPLALADL